MDKWKLHSKILCRWKTLSYTNKFNNIRKIFKIKFKSKKSAINFIKKKKMKIKKIKNSEEFILSKLGKEIYEKFYKNYTLKQWGIHPRNLDKSIVGRLPIRFNRNPYYVNQKIRVMPKHGYTQLFQNMLNDKKINLRLNTDFNKIKNKIKPNFATIYTGPPDFYFNFKYGKLDWRSLKFNFKTQRKKKLQECVQINYPNDYKYTRKVEIKHVTKQKTKYSTLCFEYPQSKGDPYYPINNDRNKNIFKKYQKLIKLFL